MVPAPKGGRRLTYDVRGSPPSDSHPVGPFDSSVDLLPSALPPTERLATPARRQGRGPSPASIGRPLRKSVTFATSPTTRSPDLQPSALSSSSSMKRTRSLPLPPPSPAERDARPTPPSPSVAASYGLTTPADSENAPLRRTSASSHRNKRQRPSQTEEDRKQERLVLALRRTLQGKIGPEGNVIPFTAEERESLKRRERRLRDETRQDKGKGKERQSVAVIKGFVLFLLLLLVVVVAASFLPLVSMCLIYLERYSRKRAAIFARTNESINESAAARSSKI